MLLVYALGVSIVGLPLLAAVVANAALTDRWRVTNTVVVLGLFIALGELLPVRVPSPGGDQEIATSTTFAFALLLTHEITVAAPVLAAATLIADVARERPLWRIGFDLARYTIALAFAGRVLSLLTDSLDLERVGELSQLGVGAIIVAGGAFFLADHVLSGVLDALVESRPAFDHLVESFLFRAFADATLLAMAPVVLVLAERNLLLLPLLIPPLGALYRVGSMARARERAARTDGLTQLPNWSGLHEQAAEAVASAARSGSALAVFVLDIDRFREINDSLGHATGDAVLRSVATRLRDAVGDGVTVGRVAGDEFAFVVRSADHTVPAGETARAIRGALLDPFPVGDAQIVVDASMGSAAYPADGLDAATLLQRADMAKNAAKVSGSRYERFTPDHDRGDPTRLTLLGELRAALATHGLLVQYQPQLSLATVRVTGAEALLRWQHPARGFVRPDAFLPLAERTGMMREITAFVMAEAVGMLHVLRQRGLPVTLSVNVSAANLQDDRLVSDVEDALRRWPVEPVALKLEVTETVAMADTVRTRAVLEALAGIGVQLSLDDYGSGYSSLAYLRRLPVAEIKIDKAFVVNMTDDRSGAAIVRSTVELGHDLGLRVVAEGVENGETLDLLRSFGCDVAQGYHIGRPEGAQDLEARMRSDAG